MKLSHKLTVVATGIIFIWNVTACKDTTTTAEKLKLSSGQHVESEFKDDTVNKPVLVRSDTDGALRLTAGNGKAIGPDIKYMPEWKAFGWFTAADRVEWDVDVEKTGEYKAQLEWSVSDEEAGKEFLLETKDQKLTGIIAPSGSWETFKTENIGNIKLVAGRQKIVFKSNKQFDKGAILDFREVKLIPLK